MPQPERKPNSDHDGPFVQVAVFCDEARAHEDGRWSFIGVHQGVAVVARPRAQVAPVFALTVSGGRRVGMVRLRLMLTLPGGIPTDLGARPDSWLFDGPAFGHTMTVPVPISVDSEGTAWLDVWLDDRLATRIPYQIRRDVAGERE